jgi:hypothetical protein
MYFLSGENVLIARCLVAVLINNSQLEDHDLMEHFISGNVNSGAATKNRQDMVNQRKYPSSYISNQRAINCQERASRHFGESIRQL